jgi:ubiquinone/menaquinone biosynthesis C-methylase UbiE
MNRSDVIRATVTWVVAIGAALYVVNQARKPDRLVGRLFAWLMNRSHSSLTDWGLRRVAIEPRWRILDVGCGGGRTIEKLAAMAPLGTVAGVDYAQGSVAASRATNRRTIEAGRVEIRNASVDRLPFSAAEFDLVTAVETHFYWPDLPAALREIRRVLKANGTLLIIAESYAGGRHDIAHRLVMRLLRSTRLTVAEHRERLTAAGYESVEVAEDPARGWIAVAGRKPA